MNAKKSRGKGVKRDYEVSRLWLKVPATKKDKLDQISNRSGITSTNILTQLIEEAHSEFYGNTTSNLAGDSNKEMNDFVNSFVLEHFGEKPEDEVEARSQALKAYYDSQGYSFGSDEDSFILPKID